MTGDPGGPIAVITMDESPTIRGNMTGGDSWSNWDPDPERAFREHDPALEPYASMSRREILDRMRDARGGREWEFLREFLLDRCTPSELHPDAFQAMLKSSMGLGYEEFCLLFEDAGLATRLRPVPDPIPPGRNSMEPDRGCSTPTHSLAT